MDGQRVVVHFVRRLVTLVAIVRLRSRRDRRRRRRHADGRRSTSCHQIIARRGSRLLLGLRRFLLSIPAFATRPRTLLSLWQPDRAHFRLHPHPLPPFRLQRRFSHPTAPRYSSFHSSRLRLFCRHSPSLFISFRRNAVVPLRRVSLRRRADQRRAVCVTVLPDVSRGIIIVSIFLRVDELTVQGLTGVEVNSKS